MKKSGKPLDKHQWKELYSLYRFGGYPETTSQIRLSIFYAYGNYPKDPLTYPLAKRLAFYKHKKKGPNPELPF